MIERDETVVSEMAVFDNQTDYNVLINRQANEFRPVIGEIFIDDCHNEGRWKLINEKTNEWEIVYDHGEVDDKGKDASYKENFTIDWEMAVYKYGPFIHVETDFDMQKDPNQLTLF